MVLLFQWFVFTGNRVELSDIRGVMFQKHDAQAAVRGWRERSGSARGLEPGGGRGDAAADGGGALMNE